MSDDVEVCLPAEERQYWFRSRCGTDRDCIPDDRQNPFRLGYCNAIAWCRTNPGSGRYVEVWNAQNTQRVFKLSQRNASYRKSAKCVAWAEAGSPVSYTYGNDPSPYTINIPGLSDIVKIPALEDPALRRQRAQRYAESKSSIPSALQWVPPLLNKLDDAQDMIYTGIAVGLGILKVLGVRAIPGLGIILGVNDAMNLAT